MTVDAPEKTDLAPTEPKTGADEKKDEAGSLLDKKPEGAQDGGKPSPEKTTDQPKTATPEKYELKAPEGITISEEAKGKFDSLAKELGLSQENYSKIAQLQFDLVEAETKQKLEAFDKTVNEWKEETKKELGADFENKLAVASKGIDHVFKDAKQNEEFRSLMKDTGLGNHSLMVKLVSFIGAMVSEDKFPAGKPDASTEKSVAERLYPDLPVK